MIVAYWLWFVGRGFHLFLLRTIEELRAVVPYLSEAHRCSVDE